jgi:asparagine synthase (glutamine-hydrolysing)
MSDAESRFWITYNGEIYNYRELAEEFRGLGHQFRGSSDTEVILAAYRQWGEACLERLRGMFAFGIWDKKTRSLFAARDRLGIKPFHYWTNGGERFVFASELKALIEFLPERRPNVRLAREFLAWNLLDHEAGETMLAGIKRLPPAHAMTWRPGDGLRMWSYWRLLEWNEELDTPERERSRLISEFRHRFEESISLHLRSDVPVGTCLSGGLDSSSIVCLANAELRRRSFLPADWQHTFSACFEEPGLDERLYIQAVADANGSRTHFVFPSGDRLREELGTWLWHQEEPVGGFGAYSQYCVLRLAREHGIKVLLDGQGADELLAGYRKFILVYLRQCLAERRYTRAIKEAAAFFLSPEILRTSRFDAGRRYLFNSLSEISQLWPGNLSPDRPTTLGLGNLLGRRLKADVLQFSLPVLLRYDDRNSMAFGVESRVPFVDHLFVEWVATLPADLRLSDGWTKRILRESLRDVLPEVVRNRKSKLGFSSPESQWLSGPLREWLNETLTTSRYLSEVVDLGGVRQLLGKRAAGNQSLHLENILFRLAIYESWGRQFLTSSVETH